MTQNTKAEALGRPVALPFDCEFHELSGGVSAIVYDAAGMAIDTHLSEAQATFIVKAVNSHDALVAALTSALVAMKIASGLPSVSDEYDFGPAIADATMALAQVEGETR